jgi:DNA-binding response OmpR family regulator
MSNMSGDEALQAIREAGYDCRVIMITAIEPEFDIVEMSFDDYLCKPIEQGTLQQAIESQLTAKEYDETVSDLFRATSKIAVLEAEKTAEELASSAEYQRLKEIVDDTRGEANSLMSEFDDFESAFKAIDRSSD